MYEKTLEEFALMDEADRYRYWDTRTDAEKWAAGVALSKARYIELGLYREGDVMDKSAFRKMTHEEWLIAEEEGSRVLCS